MLTGEQDILKKDLHKRNQNHSDEEKNKKPQYARKRYRNLSKEEKEKKCQCGCELIKLF